MIFNRTQNDVDTAIRLRNEKVKFDPITMQPINPEELTESEIAILERGFFTINTFNRIEKKQKELSDILAQYGYMPNCKNKTEWVYTDIPNQNDYLRIIENLNKLKTAFTYMNTTPATPTDLFHFQKINDVEKILADIEFLINSMVMSWIYANNEYYTGEVI